MGTATAEAETRSGWADTKAAWKKRAVHNITVPSGARLTVRYPRIPELIRNEALPQHLIHIAFMDRFAPDMLRQIVGDADKETELLRNMNELDELIALDMIVAPKVTLDDVREMPQEDLDTLKEIAQRERNTDARGVVLGVVPLDWFTTFREAHERSEDVADDHPPFPDPSCGACVQAVSEFSTIGDVLV